MDYFQSPESFKQQVALYAVPETFQQECMNVCVEKPWGKFELTYQQSRCLKNCASKHAQLQEMLFKAHHVKASARPIQYYVDTSDYTGMQVLTGRTNPNDGVDTVLHTGLHNLRRQSNAFSSQ